MEEFALAPINRPVWADGSHEINIEAVIARWEAYLADAGEVAADLWEDYSS